MESSPKSSPRRIQDSSGTLKTKISLGKNPTIVHSGPFYLVKEPPEKSDLTGATNLISHYGLEHTYSKFNSKKVKEQLSSFLPTLPCVIDGPGVIVSYEINFSIIQLDLYCCLFFRTIVRFAVLSTNHQLAERSSTLSPAFSLRAFVYIPMYL